MEEDGGVSNCPTVMACGLLGVKAGWSGARAQWLW